MYGYLDHNATTPMRGEVVRALRDAAIKVAGNPSSPHRHGAASRFLLEKARRDIARLIGAPRPECVVFTSGATEANNLALRGACFAARRRGSSGHLIVSATEHKAVLDTAKDLRDRHGFPLTILPVHESGAVDPARLAAELRPDTAIVSIIAANNETGSVNRMEEIATIVHGESDAVLHTDAVQALGRLPVDVGVWGAGLVTLSAHKVHGPRGIGILAIGDGVDLDAELTGGGQEFGLRSGTEPVELIVALAEAIRLAVGEQHDQGARQRLLREQLWEGIATTLPGARRNSPMGSCLPNTLNVSLPGVPARDLIGELDRRGFCVSAGSACTVAGGQSPSHVLLAMGLGEDRALSSIRISFGRGTSASELKDFVVALRESVASLIGECPGTNG